MTADDDGGRRSVPSAVHDPESIRSSPTEELPSLGAPTVELAPAVGNHRLRAGEVFRESYRVESLIARGGFSDVYRAQEINTGEIVALKFLSDRQEGEKLTRRMRRELRLARDLRHPNIVRVSEMIEIEGSCCLVMEYVEGRTLKDIVAEDGAMAVDRAFAVLVGLCSAMAAVHAAGIVHRDLKPQNVILTAADEVKLLDFGLAKTPDSTGLTATGTILGTPDYMSPEQVDGEIADERSDVYSLGVIAYELLVGQPPFRGDSAIAIALQHVRSRVPDPRREQPGVPVDLARLIRSMTEPSSARRPSSAQAVLMALERLAASASGTASVVEIESARPRRFVRAAIAAAAALVLAVGSLALRGMMAPSAASEVAHPLADGVVTVAFAPAAGVVGSAPGMFLDTVARAAENRLDDAVYRVLEVGDIPSRDIAHMRELGVEHLVELTLRAERGAAGKVYHLETEVLDTRDGNVWQRLPPHEMTVLDFEAVDPISERIASSYGAAVREAMQ